MRRPFLSLFLCLALAVNLFATASPAHSLFVEICSGHRTVLVPSPDVPDPADCETCVFCCVVAVPPDGDSVRLSALSAIMQDSVAEDSIRAMPRPRRTARAPPFLSI